MFRAGHLNSDILKGVEGLAASDLGATQAKEFAFDKAHTTKVGLVTGTGEGITNWLKMLLTICALKWISKELKGCVLEGLQS